MVSSLGVVGAVQHWFCKQECILHVPPALQRSCLSAPESSASLLPSFCSLCSSGVILTYCLVQELCQSVSPAMSNSCHRTNSVSPAMSNSHHGANSFQILELELSLPPPSLGEGNSCFLKTIKCSPAKRCIFIGERTKKASWKKSWDSNPGLSKKNVCQHLVLNVSLNCSIGSRCRAGWEGCTGQGVEHSLERCSQLGVDTHSFLFLCCFLRWGFSL